MEILKKNILKTLLYYDIFSHPLKDEEIFTFLPKNSIPKETIGSLLKQFSGDESCRFAEKEGYYYIKPYAENINKRIYKEDYSKKMWSRAAIVTHLIKRFPFVRAVMVTGSLSKNSSDPSSDLDFMVIASEGRLWIARTLLMLFKKVFLLNSYKYFCINYFITENHLEIEEKNIFTATEIATIKPVYNSDLAVRFIKTNAWINDYFPNYLLCDLRLHEAGCRVNNRSNSLQKVFELFFMGKIGDRLNKYFMKLTIKHWNKKYPHIDKKEREHMFRSTENVSKTHPNNMQKKILTEYDSKLKEFNLRET
ncbi:MAG: nucleotidyltransferase domain-containing protein [Chlorobi bacterium]|nr:nucleotidyltransferase domain-containing protein [Chlorobiota bacterium]MCI0716618.1 nucleotidyltransferase domain-containing protein [Chlorobiota bacterium]